MAHGITDKDSMMSVREMPWHGLGVVLEKRPKTIEEALVASGLKWPIIQKEVFMPVKGGSVKYAKDGIALGEFSHVPGYKLNIRKDTGDVLGVVADGYVPVQNADAFSFLDGIIGSEAHFETAGSIHGGRRVWVLAAIPDFVEVGGDQHGQYIYIANSHDGSMAVTVSVTMVRIVCANTLGAALSRSDKSPNTFRIRHTRDVGSRMYEARRIMQLQIDWGKRFKEMGDQLARESLTPQRFGKVLKTLYPVDETLGKVHRENRLEVRSEIMAIFQGNGPAGDTTGNAPKTKWAGWNAIAEYADWCRRYTKRTNQMSRSFEDQELKNKALEILVRSGR